jgi:hypothetical protein
MLFPPVITSLYAGIAALILVALSVYVIAGRIQNNISLGDGKNKDLYRRMRMQGNFVEYVPMILILMTIREINGLYAIWMHIFGIMMIAGRGLHAYALHDENIPLYFRQAGMALTFLVLIIGSLAAISHYIF